MTMLSVNPLLISIMIVSFTSPVAVRTSIEYVHSYLNGNTTNALKHWKKLLPVTQARYGGMKSQSTEQEEASRLNQKVVELTNEGKYGEALLLAERALAINEKVLGAKHPDTAISLTNLASLYQMKGDLKRAEPLFRRALMIFEEAYGPEHARVAITLNNLAGLYQTKGEYLKAEPLHQRALTIKEKIYGANHPEIAMTLGNLAALYKETGDYTRAEPLYKRTLAILEEAFGTEHSYVATTAGNLAALYRAKGDYAMAEPLYRRALAIKEKVLGAKHPDVAIALDNFARLYRARGDYVEAEKLGLRALGIFEEVFGPEHARVATTLNNLAELYMAKGDYALVEPLYQRVIAIEEKVLGAKHPDVAISLDNLARLYQTKGDYAKAESLGQRALAIFEEALGPEHPEVATALDNLAAVYEDKGDISSAIQMLKRGSDVREHNLALILSTGSERQKLLYIATLNSETNGIVSLHTRSAPSNAQAAHLALTTILRRKGRVLDAMTDQVSTLRRHLTPPDRELLDQLTVMRAQLAALVLRGPGRIPPAEHQAAIAQLEERVEHFQDVIGRRSSEFKVQTQPTTIEQVRQALPAGTALVEFFTYRPVKQKGKAVRSGLTRYVAYVLRKEGELLWADLGEVASINGDIAQLLKTLRCPQTVDDIRDCPSVSEVKRLARVVDERTMRPVRELLGDTRHIFLSPDGVLNLIPFGTLVDERDNYLVEGYSLTYLTSGRDLLRLQLSAESRQQSIVMAHPLFGSAKPAESAVSRSNRNEGSRRSAEIGEFNFPPLPGTAREARALGALLRGAKVLTQSAATEASLKEMSAPRILHVATHGFFLPNQSQEEGEMRGSRLASDDLSPVSTRIENPLLRSGLALEGANLLMGAKGEDGILTALETAALDLWGTKLVMLSACETGVGELKTGEGVYGLRRALVLAGSESQVISLWQVSDDATSDLVAAYYKRLITGQGRTEALRQVQLEMLRGEKRSGSAGRSRNLTGKGSVVSSDHRHPYYWAAFIQSGDWRSMHAQPGSSLR